MAKIALYILLIAGALVLIDVGVSDWALAGAPYLTQVITVLVYTGAIFLFVFFRTRGFNTGYDLNDEAVREKLPRLLILHAVFLAWVLSIQVAASLARPHLAAYWFKEYSRHDTLFWDVSILFYVSNGMAQVLISRGILGRGVEAQKKEQSDVNAGLVQNDRA